jgi:hypothetical protein
MAEDEKPGLPRNWKSWISVCSCAFAAVVLLTVLIMVIPKLLKEARLRALMANVKAGTSTGVCDPDPNLLDASLQDGEFASRLRMVSITSSRAIDDNRLALLKRFPNLEVIQIEYVGNADVFLEHIQGMASLEEMRLHHSWFSARGAHPLSTLPQPKRLCLDRATDVTLGQIRDLKQLQELEIAYGDVTDAGLEHLKHLTQLKPINLWHTGFTKQSIAELRNALPNCEVTVDKP